MTRLLFFAVFLASAASCAGRSHAAKGAPGAAAEQRKISVYVFTAPAAERAVTRDETTRADAVKELSRRLAGKDGLLVVDAPGGADVVVEVLSAVQTFTPHPDATFNDRQLTATVAGGGKTERLSEARSDLGRTVYQLANRVNEWVEANRPQILAARRKPH